MNFLNHLIHFSLKWGQINNGAFSVTLPQVKIMKIRKMSPLSQINTRFQPYTYILFCPLQRAVLETVIISSIHFLSACFCNHFLFSVNYFLFHSSVMWWCISFIIYSFCTVESFICLLNFVSKLSNLVFFVYKENGSAKVRCVKPWKQFYVPAIHRLRHRQY